MLSDNSVEGAREFMPGTIESESNALVDELIAASREIGGDPRLVLQGGGNTSVKVGWRDVTESRRARIDLGAKRPEPPDA